jgi:hypothetical protein
MKKIIIILSILGFGGIVFGAPYLIYQRSLIPIDSTENLGTTTAKWDRLFVNFASTTSLTIDGTASTTNLVISGTCTGCTSGLTSLNSLTGGTQTFSSNSLLTITSSGTDHRFVASSSPGFGALNASSTITFNNLSNGAVSVSGGVLQGGTLSVGNGGTGQSSWTQGDVLFADSTSSLTGTSTVNLKNTLKLNLVENTALSTWAGTSNITTLGTIGTGSWNATSIGNTKGGTGQDSSSWTGFAGIAGGTWSASTTLSANFIQDAYLLNTGDTGTGVYDFGGATSLELPNGAPTVNVNGQAAIDDTSGQFKWFATSAGTQIITGTSSPSFSIGSTTPDAFRNNYGTATSTFLIKNDPEAFTLTGFYCKATSTAATSNIGLIRFGDGVNWTKTGTCNTTGAFTLTTSNNTFTRFEDFILEASSTAGKIDRLTITTIINKTAD